jgi:hypothetical protein
LDEEFFILRRDMTRNLYWSLCKLPVILVIFQWNLTFLDRFSKNTIMSIFKEILSVRAELCHADGQTDGRTDMTNLIVAFRSFANAPEKYWILVQLTV